MEFARVKQSKNKVRIGRRITVFAMAAMACRLQYLYVIYYRRTCGLVFIYTYGEVCFRFPAKGTFALNNEKAK